jgi:hypothetical protein
MMNNTESKREREQEKIKTRVYVIRQCDYVYKSVIIFQYMIYFSLHYNILIKKKTLIVWTYFGKP